MDAAAAHAWVREELVRLIGVPSLSHREHDVVDLVASRCAQLGFPVRRLAVPGAADNLVVGWVDAAPTLLLNAHLDTVEPSWRWSGVAELREDRIHGLGAIDDKGGVVACLLAFVLARDAGVPLASGGVALGFTIDEEKGGSGSLVMADVLQPRQVVVAEGTDLQIGASEAGCVEVWLRTRGVAVHGALREEGVNAAEAAVKMVGELLNLPVTRDAHPRHGANVPMLWQIHAGSPLNVVPDRAEVQIDIRVVPGSSAREVHAAVEATAARHGADVEVVEVVEPFETATDGPLVTALRSASAHVTGTASALCGVQAWTDAHNFVERCGSEVVVFGPGHLRNAHSPNESIRVDDVVTCARVLAELIARTAS